MLKALRAGDFLWEMMSWWYNRVMSNVRVRTTFISGHERMVIVGEVENDRLAEQMNVFKEVSQKAGLRPGQVEAPEGSGIAVSGDAMAVINAMTPDGGPPMSPDPKKVTVLHFSRLVYRAGE